MTVSHVLNDRSDKVGAQTRERVMRVIEELHYSPSAIARGLTRRRLDAVGVVFYTRTPSALVAHSYHGDILGGILEATTQRDQSTTLFTEVGFKNNHQKVHLYCDGRCDGLIFVAPPTATVLYEALRHRSVPYVMIGGPEPTGEWTNIDVNNVREGRRATEYLIKHGHRKIAYFEGNELLSSNLLRRKGYLEALAAHGIPTDPSLIVPGLYSPESGYERTKKIVERGADRPTAIFCASDDIAFGVLRACVDLGLDVPRDVSVIGFDDTAGASATQPPLTTIRQPLAKIGAQAVELLLDMVREGVAPGHAEIVPAELIERQTVGKAKGS